MQEIKPFNYSPSLINNIAYQYETIYDRLELYSPKGWLRQIIQNPWSLIEFKADFDIAFQRVRKYVSQGSTLAYWQVKGMVNFLNTGST